MNWLTSYVKPKLEAVLKRETSDNLWHKCKGCGQMIFLKEFKANQSVCANCDHHDRIGPKARFDAMFDNSDYEILTTKTSVDDPLRFKDQKKYTDRLKEARAKSGDQDALKVAVGYMGGLETVVAVQNFFFMGGSMGVSVGTGIVEGIQRAISLKTPFIIFTAAGGARMQEGILSLMQMPRTTVAVEMLKEAGLPYIVVLTDPTTGGVTASYAMLGDIQIAEPGALIGFAGQRVIESTIREKLPEGFQSAEYLLEHGMVDMVTHRHELRSMLIRINTLLLKGGEGQIAKVG
jgi:acetyl-CoA carboxylase carboxyl transferase subunit beta